MNPNIINTNLLFVGADTQIHVVIQQMINRNVSSALVVDDTACVVGIVTERDIVRKYAVLDVEQKWSKKIRTIMTPKVVFAHLSTLKEDLINLHFRQGYRHFPVLIAQEPRQENVLGMVTVTDLCKEYLMGERSRLAEVNGKRLQLVPARTDGKGMLKQLIKGLGYDAQETKIIDDLFVPGPQNLPLVVDVEGLDFMSRDALLLRLKNYNGQIIVVSPERPEHGALSRFCNHPGRVLVTKPIDVSYLDSVLLRAMMPANKAS